MASTANLLYQCLIGMQCNDFAIVAADKNYNQSILVMKDDEDKLIQVSDKLIMGVNGDLGDIAQFTQFVVRNMKLYSLRNGYQLDTAAAVHFTRTNMADVLRTGIPYVVNLLVAGYDDKKGGELYTVDFLASCVRLPFAAHGFAGQLSVGILSQYYRPDLREEEAYELIKLCVREIHRRLIINLPNFGVKSISKDGIKILPPIRPASFDK
ncbi:proteasome subunit beta type-2-like [Leptidea sinapis]|uniref:proteasome subunit beta type-2-like n=1 Tax=Leptidea sinapis TaxID=189913 RepID=UPI0021C301DE|nr:proteasome subunit beta type-2-like [Leptidea sinapis]